MYFFLYPNREKLKMFQAKEKEEKNGSFFTVKNLNIQRTMVGQLDHCPIASLIFNFQFHSLFIHTFMYLVNGYFS